MSIKAMTKAYTASQIRDLLRNRDTNGGRAMLANLRRGIGKIPGEMPELWGIFLGGLDDALYGRNGNPSFAEWAVYLSLTLFALHQQGSAEAVHQEKISLGNAAAELIDRSKNEDEERSRIMRRFGPVITASDMQELSHHLRGMIQLFKANNVHLDYVQLAGDLFDFQYPDSRRKVQLRWGEDFYHIAKSEGDNEL
ncbi:MAG: type I-E CRISPR-associated protein Cse2/CasB [Ruminococcus sp.]|nr:type I-E CRISPR-associated protein Cse2/CasB [Ruminococcus sp.]